MKTLNQNNKFRQLFANKEDGIIVADNQWKNDYQDRQYD